MPSRQVEEKRPPFPWFVSHEGDDDDAVSNSPSRPDPPVSPDAATILVVDDDLANLALAEALLQAEGFNVRVAIDATSMFQVLKTCTPALILMDIQITAYGKTGDDKKARQAGFVEFLSKPVSTRELPGIVRRHLPGR